ncbi:hypothetical protein [Candidatus Skiveiella danica]|uniref:hypothetical protein n=1 Tax=Candidatus Skiveiella danica TaxID=3386177 RepID=UPI0039B99206
MNNYGLAVPTYKRHNVLQKLLASIPSKVPVYISDNGSTLPESFQQQHTNAVVRKIFPAVAMFKNWNLAAKLAHEEWIAVPSDDDVYYPESFEIIERCLAKYTDMDMIVFGHNTIDANNVVLNSWVPQFATCSAPNGFLKFRYGVDARMPSIFIKKKLFDQLGGFDEGFKLTAADSDLIQRATLAGNVQFIPEVVSGYRVWEGGLTHATIASSQWMEEVDRWCNRISKFCDERGITIYSNAIRDEVYAQNLLAGIISARRTNGYKAAWRHLNKCRYPFRARLLRNFD